MIFLHKSALIEKSSQIGTFVTAIVPFLIVDAAPSLSWAQTKDRPATQQAPPLSSLLYADNTVKMGLEKNRPTFYFPSTDVKLSIGASIGYDVGGTLHESDHKKDIPGIFPEFGNSLRYMRIPITLSWNKFQVIFTPDFSRFADSYNHIYEASLNYNGFDNTHLAIGLYRPRITLEDTGAITSLDALERPGIIDISRNIAGGNSRLSLGGSTWRQWGSISAYVTGPTLGHHSGFARDQIGGLTRLTFHPIGEKDMDLHLGASGSFAVHGQTTSQQLATFPELRFSSVRIVTTGKVGDVDNIWEAGPEIGFRYKNLLLKSEYIFLNMNTRTSSGTHTPALHMQGYYITASYVLFGNPRFYDVQHAGFKLPTSRKDFSPEENDWGALEWIGRWSVTDLNSEPIQGGKQTVWTTGFNWYPTSYFRIMLDYSHVFGSATTTTKLNQYGRTADFLATRMQLNF